MCFLYQQILFLSVHIVQLHFKHDSIQYHVTDSQLIDKPGTEIRPDILLKFRLSLRSSNQVFPY